MILVDTGPLVALIDRSERSHARCVSALASASRPMVTTWPVITEAMFLLHDAAGWSAQEPLWGTIELGDLVIHDIDAELRARSRQLMHQYRNVPMSLADATLVALAESLRLRQVFTLDSDFRIYRPLGRGVFEVIPD